MCKVCKNDNLFSTGNHFVKTQSAPNQRPKYINFTQFLWKIICERKIPQFFYWVCVLENQTTAESIKCIVDSHFTF